MSRVYQIEVAGAGSEPPSAQPSTTLPSCSRRASIIAAGAPRPGSSTTARDPRSPSPPCSPTCRWPRNTFAPPARRRRGAAAGPRRRSNAGRLVRSARSEVRQVGVAEVAEAAEVGSRPSRPRRSPKSRADERTWLASSTTASGRGAATRRLRRGGRPLVATWRRSPDGKKLDRLRPSGRIVT